MKCWRVQTFKYNTCQSFTENFVCDICMWPNITNPFNFFKDDLPMRNTKIHCIHCLFIVTKTQSLPPILTYKLAMMILEITFVLAQWPSFCHRGSKYFWRHAPSPPTWTPAADSTAWASCNRWLCCLAFYWSWNILLIQWLQEKKHEQDCLRVHLEKQMYQFSLHLCLCVCTHRIFPDSKCIFKREAIVLVTMISV